ncbi:hypothetical protein COV58_02140 [Candidatus Roizmanbacteria bacterium CG11_big_fil_rev_8_21_14_0_20_36_8]|uniref:Uncharacterized protein n=1 Tax=Candidatus Roizmanbacteria bacterium CG11_big_fil_rev_8_21_14_0_20_36_8 TaxID=1974856 RepID=A0A2M6IU98_9BACT|nr:MAG: hypothetical protein COV58_02140 [Candidatus Roizmanbacteria bacterium CG11_big_fil_rev_8_21_14_0_20_36_8]
MKEKTSPQKQIIDLCEKIYPKKITSNSLKIPSSDSELIYFAQKNRLIHFLALTYQSDSFYSQYAKEFRSYTDAIIKSLQILSRITDLSELLVIKTISSYPHDTSDLDILVKNHQKAEEVKKMIQDKQIHFPFDTDINFKISWTDSEEVSNTYIWSHVKRIEFNGMKIFVPNPELDVLIRVAHMPFELAEVRLGELMHIYNQSKNIRWDELEKEAQDNNWEKTFHHITALLNELHTLLYDEPWHAKLQRGKKQNSPLQFPISVPYSILARAVIEKRAWKKLWGARYILKDRLGL